MTTDTTRDAKQTVTVDVPSVPYASPAHTDAFYLRTAAWNLRHGYPVGGSNTTDTVALLLDRVATALDGKPPRDDEPTRKSSYGPQRADLYERSVEFAEALPAALGGQTVVAGGVGWRIAVDDVDAFGLGLLLTEVTTDTPRAYRVTVDAEAQERVIVDHAFAPFGPPHDDDPDCSHRDAAGHQCGAVEDEHTESLA